jgi:hypothetical protein
MAGGKAVRKIGPLLEGIVDISRARPGHGKRKDQALKFVSFATRFRSASN